MRNNKIISPKGKQRIYDCLVKLQQERLDREYDKIIFDYSQGEMSLTDLDHAFVDLIIFKLRYNYGIAGRALLLDEMLKQAVEYFNVKEVEIYGTPSIEVVEYCHRKGVRVCVL